MKVIVVMCLLYAALDAFQWDPSQGNTTDPPQKAGSECTRDHGACGCCMMWQEMNRLKTYFNTSLNQLEKEYLQSKQSFSNIKASRSAFSVALTDRIDYISHTIDKTIIYKHVFINLGDSYSTETGIFTVQRSGVYSLALTVFSDAGYADNNLATCVVLLVNDQLVVGAKDDNMQDQEDSATMVLALHLNAGDQVVTKLPSGCFLFDYSSHYNTFSGFLLYPTE